MAYCFALSLALKQRLDVTRNGLFTAVVVLFAGEIGTASGRSIGAITHWNYRSICRGSQSLLERLNELGNYSEYPRARYKTLKSWIYENHIWELRGEGIIGKRIIAVIDAPQTIENVNFHLGIERITCAYFAILLWFYFIASLSWWSFQVHLFLWTEDSFRNSWKARKFQVFRIASAISSREKGWSSGESTRLPLM